MYMYLCGPHTMVVAGTAANKCIDLPGGARAAGQKLDQWDCTNTVNQRFSLIPSGDGDWLTIKDGWSNLCWDVTGGSTANGAQIELWNCQGSDNQKFMLVGNTIVIKSSNKCVTVHGGTSANGAIIDQWDCVAGAANQVTMYAGKLATW